MRISDWSSDVCSSDLRSMRVPARFDVDGDRRLGELAPQRLFEVVAHRVRIVHAHRAGHAQAEVDEGQAPGVAGAQLVEVVGSSAERRVGKEVGRTGNIRGEPWN